MSSPLSAAAQAAEERPRLAVGLTIVLGALAAPLALVAAQQPGRIAFGAAALALVVVCLARVEVALILLIAFALSSAFILRHSKLARRDHLTAVAVAGQLRASCSKAPLCIRAPD